LPALQGCGQPYPARLSGRLGVPVKPAGTRVRAPPRALRRTVIDPVWLPLGTTAAVLLLAAAAVAAIAAPLTRRRRLLRLALFGALYLAIDVSLVISCAALWLRYPSATRRDQARWSRSHQKLLTRALSLLVTASRPLLGFRVQVQEPPDQELI